MSKDKLIQKDLKNIWHPFTQMKTAKPPIFIKRGEKEFLYDQKDNEYIDGVSSWWVNTHGHSHPYIAKKIHQQLLTLEHVIFAGFTHRPAIELSERILNYLPHQDKVFFSDNGSTAVEVGIKMAIQYFYNQNIKKNTIIALEGAYHGDTIGAMSAGADDSFNIPFKEYMFKVERVPSPTKDKKKEAITLLKKIVKEKSVCCFIYEPLIQGSGGMIMHDKDTLNEMIKFCKKNNIICIADEVMTGFYRTGKMFASDYMKHKPDIMCLSKGLTGGTLPLSLTTCNQKIYDAFLSDDKMKTFFHGHSFTGNPIGCTAALASLDLFEKKKTLKNINRIVKSHQKFSAKIKKHGLVKNLRQQGTVLAFEINTQENTSYFNNIRDQIYDFFINEKVLLRPLGNVIYIMPPYCISKISLQTLYSKVEKALNYFEKI